MAHGAVTIGAEHVHEALRELGLTEPAAAPADVPADAPAVATAAASRAVATPDLDGGRCDLEGGRCFTFKQFVQYPSVVLKEMRERPLEPAEGPSSTSTSSSRMRSVGEAPAGGERPSK